MAKIFNLHVDVYLVLKMFDFYFLKVKVDYLYLNKNALKPKKKTVENNWKTVQSTRLKCFVNIIFSMSSANSFN